MEPWELLDTDLTELEDAGILPVKVETNVKKHVLTFECCLCGYTYSNDYFRYSPDKITRGMYCVDCRLKTMCLKSVKPYTTFYESRNYERSSFSDDLSNCCYHCGETKPYLIPLQFSNHQQFLFCPVHLREYATETYKAISRKYDLIIQWIGVSHNVIYTE